jgi:hypothetical protein
MAHYHVLMGAETFHAQPTFRRIGLADVRMHWRVALTISWRCRATRYSFASSIPLSACCWAG